MAECVLEHANEYPRKLYLGGIQPERLTPMHILVGAFPR